MSYRIKYLPAVLSVLRKLPADAQRRIIAKI
jgi:hypothetical protein